MYLLHTLLSLIPPPKSLLLTRRHVRHSSLIRFDHPRRPSLLLQHLQIVEPRVIIVGRFLHDRLVLVLSLRQKDRLDVLHRAVLLLEKRVLCRQRVFRSLQVLQRPFQNRARALQLFTSNFELRELQISSIQRDGSTYRSSSTFSGCNSVVARSKTARHACLFPFRSSHFANLIYDWGDSWKYGLPTARGAGRSFARRAFGRYRASRIAARTWCRSAKPAHWERTASSARKRCEWR